jgi:hypothetical protein
MLSAWLNQEQQVHNHGTKEILLFFCGTSEAEAHYSLKELHKHIPNLARLLDVSSPENFQTLLVVSGIGSLRKNGQFIFLKNKFDSFLNVHKLQDTYDS